MHVCVATGVATGGLCHLDKILGPDLLTACDSAIRLLALKLYCQDLLKTPSDELALKRHGHCYFCT